MVSTTGLTDLAGRCLVVTLAAAVVLGASSAAGEPVGDQSGESQRIEECEAEADEECFRIDVIVVEGLLRTDRNVIDRELTFEEGEVVTVGEVEESVQRLRNIGIFRRVDYEFVDRTVGTWDDEEPERDRGRMVRLKIDERYTLSPSFRLSRGGDTLELTVGLEDSNISGSFYQGGVSYRRLAGTNSFSVWFRDPRFLDQRQSVTARVGLNNRLYTLYDHQGEIEGGYQRYRRSASLGFAREWRRWLETTATVSVSDNRFIYDLAGEARRDAQEQRGGLYGPDQIVGLGLGTRFGRINTFGHRREGTTLRLEADVHHHFGDVASPSRQARARLLDFRQLPLDATLATRTEVGARSVEPTYMQFFAGGLGTLRGTYDNRYRGTHHWLGNVEIRVPTLKTSWMVVHNVAFVDAVGVGDRPGDIAGLTAATTGLGIRLTSKDFHGLVFRVDYAPPVLGADGPGLSFGAGQFF